MLPTAMRTSCVAAAALLLSILFAGAAVAQKPSPLGFSTGQQSELHGLASRILQHADKAGCRNSCTILVVNFAGPTGATSALGIQLADALSLQLSAQASGIQIVDRAKLQQYLEKERIASKLLEDDNAARWLAMENGATAVLIGYLRGGPNQKQLRVQLLDTRDFGRRDGKIKGSTDDAVFDGLGYFGDLDPAEPFDAAYAPMFKDDPPDLTHLRESKGSSGNEFKIGFPRCTHKPEPSYTDAARRAKAQGSLVMQTVISPDGRIAEAQVLKGLPYGLNEQALEVVRTWRCEPATVDGRPVSTKVPIEVSFRLY
jgi:TonB family protein